MPDTDQASASLATDDIFAALGAGTIPDEEKAELLGRMLEIVQTRVFDKVFDYLSEEQREKLMDLMEKGAPDDVDAYLSDKVPDFTGMFETEANMLRQELLIKFAV